MNFAQVLGFLYVIVFSAGAIFSSKIKISSSQEKIFFALFAVALSVIAFNVNPAVGWDLSRHYLQMNNIRDSNISLLDFLFVNKNFVGGQKYSTLLNFNLIRWLVAKFSADNRFLPWICVLIDYTIVGYIFTDWNKTAAKSKNNVYMPMVLCFSFLPFVHCCSGLRNALSACIVALGIYFYLYKKKSVCIFAICVFLAATVHPAALITVPFVLIAKLDIGIWGYISIFVVSFLAQAAAKWMETSNYLYLRMIGSRYISYTSEEQYRGSRAPLYVIIILIIVFLTIYFLTHFKKTVTYNDENRKLIYNFFAVYMVYILGNIGNYDMILRPAYVLGPLSPVLYSMMMNKEIWRQGGINIRAKKIIRFFLILVCLVFCTYLQFKYMSVYGYCFIS